MGQRCHVNMMRTSAGALTLMFMPLHVTVLKTSHTYFMHWLRMTVRTSQRKEHKPTLSMRSDGGQISSKPLGCAKTVFKKLDSVISMLN